MRPAWNEVSVVQPQQVMSTRHRVSNGAQYSRRSIILAAKRRPWRRSFGVNRAFFARHPSDVAPALLGMLLVHGEVVGRIVETEAYLAWDDPAAHAFRGRTPRTEVLFGPPGHAYVYRTRQHRCLNVVAELAGVPGCVLIRAVAPVAGIEIMRRRRARDGHAPPAARLANGPAKLCEAFAVDMRHYGVDLCADAGLRIAADPNAAERGACVRTRPRVGVGAAKDRLLGYYVADDPNVSPARRA